MDLITISLRAGQKPLLSRIATALAIAGMALLAACAQTSAPGSQSESLSTPGLPTTGSSHPFATQVPGGISLPVETPAGQPSATVIRPIQTLPGAVKRVEPTPGAPITGEVPASLLTQIFQDLSERLKIEIEQIEISKAEQVVWNDGSLGCPQPGEFYTQALVNGYWLILEVDNVAYDYRASDRGNFFLCEPPSLPVPHTLPQ
jgi:hypothetical protein